MEQWSKYNPAEVNVLKNIRAVLSVVRAALVATQQYGKHISESVNQHAAIE
jgi:hypothetical protein